MKICGVVGWKNSGKTTLLEKLIAYLTSNGYKVSSLKHAHHSFDIDFEGKDSYRHRKAGSKEVLISSNNRWALIHENDGKELSLEELLKKIEKVDLVFVEGFKNSNISFPKIEICREVNNKEYIFQSDKNIIAIVSEKKPLISELPFFHINDVEGISKFILEKIY
tara:strand:- start:956 stop:1450 length:495 start_codon:yes stop_codon:yes gene_type:complete